MTRDDLLAWLREEHARPFAGWDFSYLHGRREHLGLKSWDLETLLIDAVGASHACLDMDTGGGEALVRLNDRRRLPARTVATETYPPNVSVAHTRLAAIGVRVVQVAPAGRLPFRAGAFDLVMNRHGWYEPDELRRVLRPRGRFVTQQVGSRTNADLHRLLGREKRDEGWYLARARQDLEAHGFVVDVAEEAFPTTRYRDVGAIAWYLKAIPWEVPDFSVDRYADALVALHELIQRRGYVDVGFHTFVLGARRG